MTFTLDVLEYKPYTALLEPEPVHPAGIFAWVKWDWLREHGAGLIALSGAESGAVGMALMAGDAPRARALAERGITTCIPSKSNRKTPIEYDRILYRQGHRIENMFGRRKDWRRIQTR